MAGKKSSTATSAPVAPEVSTKAKTMKKEVTVVTDDVVNTTSVDETTTVVESEPDRYDVVLEELTNIVNKTKELINVVKTLKKENAKSQKQASKRSRKSAGDGTKRPASGITKPTKLSDALCDFLAIPRGSQMARTDVTKMINTYIRTNNLQDQTDRRTINPDGKLTAILSPIPAGKKLSFFNMQSFIKHQFVKA